MHPQDGVTLPFRTVSTITITEAASEERNPGANGRSLVYHTWQGQTEIRMVGEKGALCHPGLL